MIENGPTGKVARYYNENTRRFLSLGHGSRQSAIHRAVWGPGVDTREEAMHYVHGLVLSCLKSAAPGLVVDLGCGIGGSMVYLYSRHPCPYRGITISETQYTLGKEYLRKDSHAVRIYQGDFLKPDFYRECREEYPTARVVAFAVESFLHSPSVRDFFKRIGSFLREDDRLIICDDFLGSRAAGNPGDHRSLQDFRSGWNVYSLVSPEEAVFIAGKEGFQLERNIDLTSFLELGRTRDHLIRALVFLSRVLPLRTGKSESPWWNNLLGGNALQDCLRKRLVEYRFLQFRRLSQPG